MLSNCKEKVFEFDLIISNQTIPELTGVELAEAIYDIRNTVRLL